MRKLIIHKYIVEILNILPELQRGKVLGLLIAYNETGIMPTNYGDDIAPAMQSIKETLQYIENISKVRSEAGKKGGGNPLLIKQNAVLYKQKEILYKQNTTEQDILYKQNGDLYKQTENSDNIYNINNNTYRVNNNKEKIKKKEKKEKSLEERKQEFYNSLIPFVEEFGKEMVRDFFDYWTETNKSGKGMRFEGERYFCLKRRLSTWRKNNKDRNYGNSKPAKPTLAEEAAELVESYLNGSRTTPSISDFG